jgi:hypothetical protein
VFESLRRVGCLDHHVRPAPVGPRLDRVVPRRGTVGAQPLGYRGAVRQGVDDETPSGARRLRHLRNQQPNGPRPEHRNGVHHLDLGEIDRVDRHAQRLQQGRRNRTDRLRDRDDLVGVNVDRLGEPARVSHGALEVHVRAQVGVPPPTPFAVAAGMGRVHGYDGPRRQAKSIRTLRRHRRRHLVAEDERLVVNPAPGRALSVVMQVAAAEPDRPHPEGHLPIRRRGTRDGLHPHVAGPVQTHSTHGVGRDRCLLTHLCP